MVNQSIFKKLKIIRRYFFYLHCILKFEYLTQFFRNKSFYYRCKRLKKYYYGVYSRKSHELISLEVLLTCITRVVENLQSNSDLLSLYLIDLNLRESHGEGLNRWISVLSRSCYKTRNIFLNIKTKS